MDFESGFSDDLFFLFGEGEDEGSRVDGVVPWEGFGREERAKGSVGSIGLELSEMTTGAFRDFIFGSCFESFDLRCLLRGRPSIVSWIKNLEKVEIPRSDKPMTPSGGPFASILHHTLVM